MVERYAAALKDVDRLLDIPMRVNPDDLVDVRRKYRRNPALPIERPLKPDTPSQAINKAGEYVLKQAQKGFVNIDPSVSTPSQVYKLSYVPIKFKELEREWEVQYEPSYKSEEFQRFWQSTDVVTRTVEELQALPYEDPADTKECEGKYREMIAGLVRKMNQQGLLDERRKTRQQLFKIMQEFMAKAKKRRVKLIRSYLQKGRVLWVNLSDAQKKEFPEFEPPKPPEPEKPKRQIPPDLARHQEEVDARVLKRVMASAKVLPSVYSLDGIASDERAMTARKLGFQRGLAAAEWAMHSAVDRPPRPILESGRVDAYRGRTRGMVLTSLGPRKPRAAVVPSRKGARIVEPRLPTQEQYASFWVDSDPLKRERQGKRFNPLEQLSDVTKNFRGVADMKIPEIKDEDVVMPFKLESSRIEEKEPEEVVAEPEPEKEAEEVADNVFSTSVSTTTLTEGEHVEEQKPLVLYGGYDVGRADSDDVKFLAERTEDLKGREGEEAYHRLEKIWEKLGFSIQQKLDMAIKYSSTIEESGRLPEALNIWEAAFTAAEAYEKSYITVKDFLRMEAPTSNHRDVTFKVLLVALKEAEDSLVQVEGRLKQQLGDEFVVRRRRVQDLMEQRRMKLKIMSKDLDIDM